jgi:hypothetical protein
MFGNSSLGGIAELSFLYPVIAATYFLQASRTHRSHVRNALRNLDRECVIDADRMVPMHARPDWGPHPLTSNTQS